MAMSDTTPYDNENDRENPFDDPADENAAHPGDDETLDLGDDDTGLPWLEGVDDEDEYEGSNTGQLIAFVLAGLLLLGLIVGGIWWLSNRGEEREMVADGSIIEAPEGDYKEKPADPGGKTFEGTGDSSFAVSEGETRPAQLGKEGDAAAKAAAKADDSAKPGFETVGKDSGSESAAPADAGAAVQINAYTSRSSAEDGWNTLSQRYSELSGKRYRIVEGKADIGTVYRLQVLPGDAAAAKSLCSSLKASGLNCFVK